MENKKLRDRAILMIMERIGVKNPVVTDIQRNFFSSIKYSVLVRPLVIEYVESGRNMSEAAIKFSLTRKQVVMMCQKKGSQNGSQSSQVDLD